MKDGSIKNVDLKDWCIYAEFEGCDRYFNPKLTKNKVSTTENHICLWLNENNNNYQAIFAVPSFPVKAVCVERNYNNKGLYLFLKEN